MGVAHPAPVAVDTRAVDTRAVDTRAVDTRAVDTRAANDRVANNRVVVAHSAPVAVDRRAADNRAQRAATDGRQDQAAARWNSRLLQGFGGVHHSETPGRVKNQKAEVNQIIVNSAASRPPSTGSAHPGIPRSRSDSIFAAKTP